MATYYAAANGSASNPGTSGSPWNAAKAGAVGGPSSGDTVIFKNGTYNLTMDMRVANVTYQAESPLGVIFDGKYHDRLTDFNIYDQATCKPKAGLPYVDPAQARPTIHIMADDIEVDGFFIRNQAGAGFVIDSSAANVVVRNSKVDFCYSSLILLEGPDALAEDCVFTRGAVVHFASCDAGETGGCKACISGAAAKVPSCVNMKFGLRARVNRCEVAYCYAEGLVLGREGRDCTGENCLIHNNKHGNIYINRHINPTLRNCAAFTGQFRQIYELTQERRSQPPLLIRDETADTDGNWYTTGLKVYNNILVGGRYAMELSSGPNNWTALSNSYIGHNTFIGFGNTDLQDVMTDFTIKFEGGVKRGQHNTTLVENNIIIHMGAPGEGDIIRGDKQNTTWRNNLWSFPNRNLTNAQVQAAVPSAFRGSGDVYTNDPKLVNIVNPVDNGVVDGSPSHNFNKANYGPRQGSPAIDAASDGSVVGGAPVVNVNTDIYGNARPSNRTLRDLGAIEYGGTTTDPGTVTAAFTVAPTSGPGPLTVSVTDTSSTTGGVPVATLTRWIYDWGDGVVESFNASSIRAHVYTASGQKTLRMTVENSNGASDSVTQTITVTVVVSAPIKADVEAFDIPQVAGAFTVPVNMDGSAPQAVFMLSTGSPTGVLTGANHAGVTAGVWAHDVASSLSIGEFMSINDNVTPDGTEGWSRTVPNIMAGGLAADGALSSSVSLTGVEADLLRFTVLDPENGDPPTRRAVAVAFAGAQFRAIVRSVVFAPSSDTYRLELPFTPDSIIAISTFSTDGTSWPAVNAAQLSIGFGTPTQQWAMGWGGNLRLTANRIAQNPSAAADNIQVQAWQTNAVTLARFGARDKTRAVTILAMNTGGRAQVSAPVLPTVTTPTDYPLNHTPGFLMSLMSQLTSSGASGGQLGRSAGLYLSDGVDEETTVWGMVNNATPTDTWSGVLDGLHVQASDRSDAVAGAVDFGTDKMTVDLSTFQATGFIFPSLSFAATEAPTGLVADFRASLEIASPAEVITFTYTGVDGTEGPVTNLVWDFGDGEFLSATNTNPVTHTYQSAGKFTVRVVATSATDSDEEVKVDYITIVGVVEGSGEVYGGWRPQTITNYSPNKVGWNIDMPDAGKLSFALDQDVLLVRESGPDVGWIPFPGRIMAGYDQATGNWRFLRPDGKIATLVLNWQDAGDGGGGGGGGGGTLNLGVLSGTGDGHQFNTGVAPVLNNNAVILSAGGHWAACRIPSVGVPRGATITSFKISMDFFSLTYPTISMNIYLEDVANSAGLTDDIDGISSRARTPSFVSWTQTITSTGRKESPELKTLLQRIVEKGDWQPNNPITVIFDAVAPCDTRWRAADYQVDAAMKAVITYTV